MKPLAVLHDASREYIYPSQRNKLFVKLKISGGHDLTCSIVFWNRFDENVKRTQKLECAGRDGEFAYYAGELSFDEAARYLRYCFIIHAAEQCLYVGRDGIGQEKPGYFFEYLWTNEEDLLKVPDWAGGALFYHIFPERFFNGDASNDPAGTVTWDSRPTRENFFGGDIKGILLKLDHLEQLQVDALYINPLFRAPSNHKYDTIDYYAIDPSFGDINAVKELVKECHKRSIKVIFDGVFNHCGYYFPPFQDVLKNGQASAFRDWFMIDSFPVQTDPPNYECVGYYKWMPKLRMKNRRVRDYFIDVGTYWIQEADIDGWRLDVADEVDFTFWQEFRRAAKGVKADALLIAETWKDGRDMLRGDQMDSVMNYLFRDAVVDFFARGMTDAARFDHLIQRMLHQYPSAVYPVLYNLIGSHDTPRFLNLCGGNISRMKLAVAFQMTFPGMPVIYYGDETGLDGENDPDCRKAMNWDNFNKELLGFYKTIATIRKGLKSLMHGSFRSIVCDGNLYGYARSYEDENTYIIINNSDTEKSLSIPLFEDVSEICKLTGILKGTCLYPKQIESEDAFYNSDICTYRSKFEMVLPAYHFEIIKTGRNSL